MEYFTLDNPTYANGKPINGIYNATWIERYLEAGEFNLTVDATMANLSLLALGTFISHTSSLQVMYIEEQSIDASIEGQIPRLTVSGRTLEAFFENRVAWDVIDVGSWGIEYLNGELEGNQVFDIVRTNETGTTLTALRNAGSTSFAVADTTGFKVNSLIEFGGADPEELFIASVSTSSGAGNVVTTDPSVKAHANGVGVKPVTVTFVEQYATAAYIVPLSGHAAIWNQVNTMLNHFLTSNIGTLSKYVLPNVVIRVASSGMGTQTTPPVEAWVVPWGNLYDAMIEGLQQQNCGIKIERPTSTHSTLDFIIHKGEDRSGTIQLSWSSGQIDTARYLWSIKDYKNEMYVRTKYQGFMIPNVGTTLTANSAALATSFSVADRTGFVPGAKLAFNPTDFIGTSAEQLTISSSYVPATGAGAITTTTGATFLHSSGLPVFQNTVPTRKGWDLRVGSVEFGEYDLDPRLFDLATKTIQDLYLKVVTENKGQIELAGLKKLSLMDITTGRLPKKFRVDYNIGDIVYVVGDYGVSQKMRVTEYAEILDELGSSSYPTLTLV